MHIQRLGIRDCMLHVTGFEEYKLEFRLGLGNKGQYNQRINKCFSECSCYKYVHFIALA